MGRKWVYIEEDKTNGTKVLEGCKGTRTNNCQPSQPTLPPTCKTWGGKTLLGQRLGQRR